ncbi:hypothetical protein F1189_31030 [Rhodovastum atsumiense]|uniref:Uncharacterized protein n=1 Tax=Rhodovastum atsumiense TaxID=504468 RepID=A0A5M6IIJ8_9PROT|nr:hypothetical protein F1189_31030 [Rhodovastum atsumiense]
MTPLTTAPAEGPPQPRAGEGRRSTGGVVAPPQGVGRRSAGAALPLPQGEGVRWSGRGRWLAWKSCSACAEPRRETARSPAEPLE